MCKSLLQLLRQAAYKHGGAIMPIKDAKLRELVVAVDAAEFNHEETRNNLQQAKDDLVDYLITNQIGKGTLTVNMNRIKMYLR